MKTLRDVSTLSVLNPLEYDDFVRIDGQDWQLKHDNGGWYLTTDGKWSGAHPTIKNISSMIELIRVIVQTNQ